MAVPRTMGNLAAALFAAVLLGLSWTTSLGAFSAPCAIALLIWVIFRESSLPRLAVELFLVGLIAFGISCSWMFETAETILGDSSVDFRIVTCGLFVLLAAKLSLFGCVTKVLVGQQNGVQLPIFFSFFVWQTVVIYLPSPFPWGVGYTLTDLPFLTQTAELGGESAVACFVFLVACFLNCLFDRAGQNRKKEAIAYLFAIGLYLFTNTWLWEENKKLANNKTKVLTIGVVQMDMVSANYHSQLVTQTKKVAANADLILWPESSLGHYGIDLTNFSDADQVFAHSHGFGFQFQPYPDGGVEIIGTGESVRLVNNNVKQRWASAFHIGRDQSIQGRRHKVYLMPFGEYFPGPKFLRAWIFGTESLFVDHLRKDYTKGESFEPFLLEDHTRVGAMICSEDLWPNGANELARHGAELLVCVMNGSLFGSPQALKQHFRIARLRAVETRLPLVRCGDRGVSCYVLSSGEIHTSLSIDHQVTHLFDVQIESCNHPTLYSQWGQYTDCFPPIACVFLLILQQRRRANQRKKKA